MKITGSDLELPPSAALAADAARFTELAHALSSPTRTAILRTLAETPEGLPLDLLAARTAVDAAVLKAELSVLAGTGLVREKRQGVLRRKVFCTDIADIELRFTGTPRAPNAREQTTKALRRNAKKRSRQARRLARKETKLARSRSRLPLRDG